MHAAACRWPHGTPACSASWQPPTAVIPKWAAAIFAGEAVYINGDGLTSRDFCFVANAVQANLLAGAVDDATALNQVYNVAVGDQTDLNRLHAMLLAALQAQRPGLADSARCTASFGPGMFGIHGRMWGRRCCCWAMCPAMTSAAG